MSNNVLQRASQMVAHSDGNDLQASSHLPADKARSSEAHIIGSPCSKSGATAFAWYSGEFGSVV